MMDAVAAVDDLDMLDGRVEVEINDVTDLVVDVAQHDVVDVRAEVTDGRVEQLEPILGTDLLEVGACRGIELGRFTAVLDIDLVDITHQLERFIAPDVFVHRAAEIIGDVVLAVRERARAAEAGHDRAGLAFDAGFDFVAVDGAFALFECVTGLKYGDL